MFCYHVPVELPAVVEYPIAVVVEDPPVVVTYPTVVEGVTVAFPWPLLISVKGVVVILDVTTLLVSVTFFGCSVTQPETINTIITETMPTKIVFPMATSFIKGFFDEMVLKFILFGLFYHL